LRSASDISKARLPMKRVFDGGFTGLSLLELLW